MFAFVDGLNNSYSTKATRSHVMTNAYREKKKLQAKNKTKSKKILVPKTWTFEVHSSPPLAIVPSDQASGSNCSTPELSFSTSGSLVSSSPPDSFNCSDEELLAELSSHSSFQPRTIIPAGLIDHFSTLPVPRTQTVDEFVAACTCPSSLHNMPTNQKLQISAHHTTMVWASGHQWPSTTVEQDSKLASTTTAASTLCSLGLDDERS